MSEQTSVTTCKFPGCENPPEPATAKPGRPPEYCADPAHTRVSAWRERRRLEAEAAGTTTPTSRPAQPLTMARVAGARSPPRRGWPRASSSPASPSRSAAS